MHGVNFSILHILIDLSSNPIQLVTHGEEVYIQIGNHNMCHLNIDISNELQTEEESGSTNDEGDLVQMTLQMHTVSSSGIFIAFFGGKNVASIVRKSKRRNQQSSARKIWC